MRAGTSIAGTSTGVSDATPTPGSVPRSLTSMPAEVRRTDMTVGRKCGRIARAEGRNPGPSSTPLCPNIAPAYFAQTSDIG